MVTVGNLTGTGTTGAFCGSTTLPPCQPHFHSAGVSSFGRSGLMRPSRHYSFSLFPSIQSLYLPF